MQLDLFVGIVNYKIKTTSFCLLETDLTKLFADVLSTRSLSTSVLISPFATFLTSWCYRSRPVIKRATKCVNRLRQFIKVVMVASFEYHYSSRWLHSEFYVHLTDSVIVLTGTEYFSVLKASHILLLSLHDTLPSQSYA